MHSFSKPSGLRLLAAALAVVAIGAGATLASAHPSDPGTGGGAKKEEEKQKGAAKEARERQSAVLVLTPVGALPVSGLAHLEQKGKRLTGYLAVWGLAPGSAHAFHVHGPNARCMPESRRTMRHAAEPKPDLVADAQGVAFARISAIVSERVLRKGYYLMVHMHGSEMAGHGTNPGIACGNVRLSR